MNGIEKITARIEADCKAEAAQILREGEEKAAAIRAEYEAKAQAAHDEAAARLAKLEDVTVTIRANASPEGKLYGSIGPRDIADALTAQTGVEFEKSEVVMGEGPFRLTGEYEVLLHLHADVETSVPVIVEAESAA